MYRSHSKAEIQKIGYINSQMKDGLYELDIDRRERANYAHASEWGYVTSLDDYDIQDL